MYRPSARTQQYADSTITDDDGTDSVVYNRSEKDATLNRTSYSSSSSLVGESAVAAAAKASNERNRFANDKINLMGPITLELIDDFLNPANRTRPAEYRPSYNMRTVSTATGGFGLSSYTRENTLSSIHSSSTAIGDVDSRLEKMREERKRDEASYRRMRYEFERELIQISNLDASFDENNNTRQDETSTVVGSGMHKMEIVSTLSGGSHQNAEIRKRAERLGRMTTMRSDASDVLSSTGGGFNDVEGERAARLITASQPLSEEPSESELARIRLAEFLKTYTERTDYDPRLPITRRRADIIAQIKENQFSIIVGGTGCGKTTQVPQYILDEWSKQGNDCNIVVTQPRRIAAISVARRVCDERRWRLGDTCGYQIGLDRENVTEKTRICYVTTGVLLQKLIAAQNDPRLANVYTHIILDEVHERDLDTDFVLLVLKLQTYCKRKSNVKVVLMSATIDTRLFAEYFAQQLNSAVINLTPLSIVPAPVLEIECSTYRVQEFYWDDLTSGDQSPVASYLDHVFVRRYQELYRTHGYVEFEQLLGRQKPFNKYPQDQGLNREYIERIRNDNRFAFEYLTGRLRSLKFDLEDPTMSSEAMLMVICLLMYFDELDINAIKESPDYYEEETEDTETDNERATKDKSKQKRRLRIINGLAEQRGSVLIFVPGMEHIKELQELLSRELATNKLNILPLHSDIVIDQQKLVFEPTMPLHRKVIISTTIAESSITVPDVKYVIDFCLTKELYSDPSTSYTHLRMEWASKSSLNQRRGRAGRVSDGMCFRLATRRFVEDDLDSFALPAILREPLHKVILDTKRLKTDIEPKRLLSLAIQPPKLIDIERTVLRLKEVGALGLTKTIGQMKVSTPHDGDLTYAGSIMAALPLDVKLSKLILLGHSFGMLRECIILAASMSTKTFFTCYFKAHLEAFEAKWMWSAGWMCDCIATLNAYNVYEEKVRTHAFDRRGAAESWARSQMIELNRIREVEKLKTELESRLRHMNIVYDEQLNSSSAAERNNEDIDYYLVLKMIVCGAFYPNYFNANKIDLQEAQRMVGGRDMKSTVQLKNMPMREGILYSQQINEIFKPCAKVIQVHFEDTRVYVEFKSKCESVTSAVNLGVYMAVQMRLLRFPLRLRRFSPRVTMEKLEELENKRNNQSGALMARRDSETGISFCLNHMASDNESIYTYDDDDIDSLAAENDDEDELNRTLVDSDNSDADYEDIYNGEDDEDGEDSSYRRGAGTNDSRAKKTYLQLNDTTVSCYDNEEGILDLDRYRRRTPSSNMSSRVSVVSSSSKKSNSKQHTTGVGSDRSAPMLDIRPIRMISTCKDFRLLQLSNPRYVLPPQPDRRKIVNIQIGEVIECGRFWAQIEDSTQCINVIKKVHEYLNAPSYKPKPLEDPHEDDLCATSYVENDIGSCFYRARILSVNKYERKAIVLFVDFGNTEKRKYSELFELDEEMYKYPFQAIECKIGDIKPDLIKNPNGVWTHESSAQFAKLVKSRLIQTKSQEKSSSLASTSSPSSAAAANNKKKGQESKYSEWSLKVLGIDDNSTVLCQLFGLNEESEVWEDLSEDLVDGLGLATKLTESEQLLNTSRPHVVGQASAGPKYYVPNRESDYMSTRANYTNVDTEVKRAHQSAAPVNRVRSSKNLAEEEFDRKDGNNNSSQSEYSGSIELRGPYSPLEITYYALTNIAIRKRCRVERDSINYVTLDDDPMNPTNRLLVAAEVSLNEQGSTIIMRKTTLMPKIEGLSTICCLLFAPTIELRPNEKSTAFTGALCGLGFDDEKNGAPIYKDNDIECAFDIKIDPQDLVMINKVRIAINEVIGNKANADTLNANRRNLTRCQEIARETLLKLILRKRESVEPVLCKRPAKWNLVDKSELLDIITEVRFNTETAKFYTLHKRPHLKGETITLKQ